MTVNLYFKLALNTDFSAIELYLNVINKMNEKNLASKYQLEFCLAVIITFILLSLTS